MVKWDTATEWDAAQSESGVVHESVTNTDHDDDTAVKQGYSIASPLYSSNLAAFWPLQEDSGSTANDFSGNSNDGSVTNATLNATGILGTSAYSFDGNGDYVQVSDDASLDITGDITIAYWTYFDGANADNNWQGILNKGGNSSPYSVYHDKQNGVWRFRIDGTEYATTYDPANSKDVWEHHIWSLAGSTLTFEVDGGATHSESISAETLDNTNTTDVYIGRRTTDGLDWYHGRIADLRILSTSLTSSERQTLYDVGVTGALTTAAKTL